MDDVVDPLLHSKLPAAVVDNVVLPQLFSTITTGAVGIAFGAAVPLPASLVQPSTVVVTV